MKIISYSDLHLEFGSGFSLPNDIDADLMILAGDIVTFRDYSPLSRFLHSWHKPLLFVAGNHEYYTQLPMKDETMRFKEWLGHNHPNVHFLQNESIVIDGVDFFGGTMWTDFNGSCVKSMNIAEEQMNDYRQIKVDNLSMLTPAITVAMHAELTEKLLKWLADETTATTKARAKVVITHHAPVINPNTKHSNSLLQPAFNSLDMVDIITKYQPSLWVYGHTHECDHHSVGQTKIISNQLGYRYKDGSFECKEFDPYGMPVTIELLSCRAIEL